MLHTAIGYMNSGKSLFIVYKGLLDYIKGRKVYSNMNLNFPHFKVNKDYLMKAGKEGTTFYNTTFLLDEFWIWFDCRTSSENKLATNFLLQSSKEDTDIYLTAQDNDQNDKRVRRNQHFVTICERKQLIGNRLRRIRSEQRILPFEIQRKLYIYCKTYKYELIGLERKLKLTQKLPLKALPIFKLYNTHQKIKSE